nr:PH domain-containing protein [Dietzia aerolata]
MSHRRPVDRIGEHVTSSIANIAAWTFVAECPIPNDIGPLLVQGEQPIAAYKTFRDSAIFTTKRLIVRDAQGLTGKKVEIYSLPYNSINMWSSENAGRILDFNSELELWTRAGHIKINLGKDVDIRKLDHLISHVVLNG